MKTNSVLLFHVNKRRQTMIIFTLFVGLGVSQMFIDCAK